MQLTPRWLLACLLAFGCSPAKVDTGDATSTSSESTMGDGDGDSEPSDTGEDTDSTSFVAGDDFPTCSLCDELAQDCPDGEKCSPGVFPAVCGPPSCKPIIGDVPPGELCSIVDHVDDCDASSWCYPGQLGLAGPSRCIEFCQGTLDDSSCSNPDEVCVVDKTIYEGPLGCRSRCNPLMPGVCSAAEMCTLAVMLHQSDFACVPDGAVAAAGEPCSFNQQCIAGLCVAADALPECADDRCCASFCDMLAPDCPIATECVHVELADNPDSTVGVCSIPG